MNQRFLAKLRNALGVVVVLCALMSAESASAQNFFPNQQAIQVINSTLQGVSGQPGSVNSNVQKPTVDVTASKVVTANSVQDGLFVDYLQMVAVELKQGQTTGAAINNVYNTIAQAQGSNSGSRMSNLDAVKHKVIDLLSN